MKPIKDCNEHTACFIDESTGYVEAKYKNQTTSTFLAVGGSFVVERDTALTIITRVSDSKMKVTRQRVAA